MSVSIFDPSQLIRANITNLRPYTPILPFEVLSKQLGRHPDEIVKLDANENPYGPSPLVAERLAEAAYLHIYPDPESRELRQALAAYTGIDPEYLLVGHGADELIDLLFRLFIDPGDAIVNCPPTFGMYAFDADVNAAEVINVERQPDFALDIVALENLFQPENAHSPKLIFVTSPNNPDGSSLSDGDLRRLLALPAIVVLDEAYIEFSSGSRIQWVADHNNLIVLRTFSKWAGLAGLRVGYGAFPLDMMDHLWKIKQPYNVNVAGQIAALASLADQNRLMHNVQLLINQREKLYNALQQIEWLSPYPSQTNFILCRVVGRDAVDIKNSLAERGILVRYYNASGLSDHIRVSIGTPAQMARLLERLQSL